MLRQKISVYIYIYKYICKYICSIEDKGKHCSYKSLKTSTKLWLKIKKSKRKVHRVIQFKH